jgi:hypothetical protein
MKHIFRAERKDKKGRRINAWAWCGYHTPWAEFALVRTDGRTVLVRKRYSKSFMPQLMPKDQFISEDIADFADCPGCKQSYLSGVPGRPWTQAGVVR